MTDDDRDVKLVYIGKIIALDPIPNADFILNATVICGSGGKWKGIVKKGDFEVMGHCIVYLPDSVIPESEEMKFMEATNWRVRMRKFRGAPSEVVITKIPFEIEPTFLLGADITKQMGVKRYFKPIPESLAGEALGYFPTFIPKTDEPNYQTNPDMIEYLTGLNYYITLKIDGSSTTAYKYNGHFGVCSRNLELKESDKNGYWKLAHRYNLKENLPDGIALQYETAGPGIQCNPMGLKEISAFAFSAFNILDQKYLEYSEFMRLCVRLNFPIAPILEEGEYFDYKFEDMNKMAEGTYPNGKQREGIVIRSQMLFNRGLISFKVINLNYEK